MKNEDEIRHDSVAEGAVDSNDQQNHSSTLHIAPPRVPGDTSNCLVAVVLHCKEADELAAAMLPATAAVFGEHWLYLAEGKAPAERFTDPQSGQPIVEIRDATSEFTAVGASTVDAKELFRTAARLAAFCLSRRHCDGVIDGDDENLIRALDNIADARVTERIVFWIDYPPADA